MVPVRCLVRVCTIGPSAVHCRPSDAEGEGMTTESLTTVADPYGFKWRNVASAVPERFRGTSRPTPGVSLVPPEFRSTSIPAGIITIFREDESSDNAL